MGLLVWGIWVLPFTGWPFRASPRRGQPPLTPAWALECWIWEDDANTAEAVQELLRGCEEHDLPVRTVLIDSPWSTRYNDFTVDEARYPAPGDFFRSLDRRGYRVVLWMTSLVNRLNRDTALKESTDFFEHARDRGWLTGGGREMRWWKGSGGFLDYTHPEAVAWWHSLQQPVLEWGIDGWKLDGTDTLFLGPGFLPWQSTHAGRTTTRAYMDLYAREEYQHGLTRNPEFIVLTRAVDNRYFPFAHPEGFAPIDAAPVTWVGDRTHEWSSKGGEAGGKDAILAGGSLLDRGFEGALRDILASSALRYPVVGCDIGGYHGSGTIPPRLYIRWAQFAAFTGLFLNGGHGERRLWKRSPEELAIVRTYAWMHTELVPYLYSHVVGCHQGGPSLMRPLPGPYHYLLGDDLLVAPIYRDDSKVQITLPAGRWRPLFHPEEALEGPQTLTREVPLHDYPVFIRDGAILPLQVSRSYTGFGDTDSAGQITWLVHPDSKVPGRFTLHHPDRSGVTEASVTATADGWSIRLSGNPRPHRVRVLLPARPTRVLRGGRPLVEGPDFVYDAAAGYLVVRQPDAADADYAIQMPAGDRLPLGRPGLEP